MSETKTHEQRNEELRRMHAMRQARYARQSAERVMFAQRLADETVRRLQAGENVADVTDQAMRALTLDIIRRGDDDE